MTNKLTVICGHCGFETLDAAAALDHMMSTGHGVPVGFAGSIAESGEYAEIRDAIDDVQAGRVVGTLVDPDDPDVPPEVREALDTMQEQRRLRKRREGGE